MSSRVQVDALRVFLESLMRAAGLPDEDARTCAAAFLLQEMRGVKTHGLLRVTQNLESLRSGEARGRPRIRALRDEGATVLLDGDRALGIIACTHAMERAMEKARAHGIGMAVVVESNHFLGAAPYCLKAAQAGLIGICFSNSFPSMSYPGTKRPVMGNAPIGYALPTSLGYPIVFDAALTASGGKLRQWAREGASIPEGFAGLDETGSSTTDPAVVLRGGSTLPIGLHKGAGLALLVEVLTGVLGGGGFLHGRTASTGDGSWQMDSHSQTCIAVNPEHFMSLDELEERVAAYARELKAAGENEEVLIPGERAHRSMEECLARGVPIDDEVAAELRDAAGQSGVTPPF